MKVIVVMIASVLPDHGFSTNNNLLFELWKFPVFRPLSISLSASKGKWSFEFGNPIEQHLQYQATWHKFSTTNGDFKTGFIFKLTTSSECNPVILTTKLCTGFNPLFNLTIRLSNDLKIQNIKALSKG